MVMSANLSNESFSRLICNPYPVKIGQVIVYSIIVFSSLVGNIILIFIVFKRQELKTTTNLLIANMAASDFIFSAISIPVNVFDAGIGKWNVTIAGTAGLMLCRLQSFLESVSFTVSIHSLAWIAVDRYVAVVFPMKARLISSRARRIVIASTWFVAMAVNSLDWYLNDTFDENEKVICSANFAKVTDAVVMFVRLHIVLFQITPFIVTTVLYCAIAVVLRRQDKVLQGASQARQKDQAKRRAVRMAFSVMAAFYTCYLPILTTSVFEGYGINPPCAVRKIMWVVVFYTAYSSSLVNPIICFAFVQSYRNGLKEVLKSCGNKRKTAGEMESGDRGGLALRKIKNIHSKSVDSVALSR